jgi:hypothetical protein
MRKHFDPSACRLIPVKREATLSEHSFDTLEALHKSRESGFARVRKLTGQARDKGDAVAAEILKHLREDREIPADVMERVEPGKHLFLENWNRLCKRLKEVIEKDAPKRRPRQRRRP